MQAVDGLTPSKYLLDTAVLNIEGKITLKEAKKLIESHYEQRPNDAVDENRTEEADKVSVRITEILLEPAFSFTSTEYLAIHKRLFQGIYKHARKIRDYNITKKEWVLNGATVTYGSATQLKATLEYDIVTERKFDYDGVFGRRAIVKLLSLKNSSASKLISKLLLADVIEPVLGYGKGKYKFKD